MTAYKASASAATTVVKAGVPDDTDWTSTGRPAPPLGQAVIDTQNDRIWYRTGTNKWEWIALTYDFAPKISLRGVHQDMGFQGSGTIRAQQATNAASLGCTISRSSFLWHLIEGTQGVYDWSRYDDVVHQLFLNGIEPYFTFYGSPQWANGNASYLVVPNAGSGRNTTFDTWVSRYVTFMQAAVARYKVGGSGPYTGVKRWEIWNEPNLPGFWSPTVDYAQYAYFYDQLRAAILTADSTAQIAVGGIASFFAPGTGATAGRTWLSNLISDAKTMPYVALHPYTDSDRHYPDQHDPRTRDNFDAIAWAKRDLDLAGYTSTKLWITEWGDFNSTDSTVAANGLQYWADKTRMGLEMLDRRYSGYVDLQTFFWDHMSGSFPTSGLYQSDYTTRTLSGDAFYNYTHGSYDIPAGNSGLQVKVGTFTAKTSTGTQAVTGVGFRPKALIVYATLQTGTGFAAHDRALFGFSDGRSNRCVAWASDDAVATSNCGRLLDVNLVAALTDGTPTTGVKASVVSFDSDGFTLNYSVGAGSAWVIHYVALGGKSILNAVVGDIGLPATTTGSWPMRELGFKHNALFIAGHDNSSSAYPISGTGLSSCYLGVADGSSQVLLVHDEGDAQATANPKTRVDASRISGQYTNTNRDIRINDFTDTLGAGLSIVNNRTWQSQSIFLGIQGGNFKLGSLTQPTSTGSQAVTGVGFQPQAVLFFGGNLAADGTDATYAKLSIGATDGTNQNTIAALGKAGAGSQPKKVVSLTDHAIVHATPAATTDATATIVSMDADGFTLNWDAADATARKVYYLAFAG